MNVKLTDRDKAIIKFLREYKCANTHTLAKLFFTSQTLAERRLKKLVDSGHLRRYRMDILHPYIFYIGKRPTNIVHSCMISEIYAELISKYQVIKIQREYEIRYGTNMVRVDLMAVLRINNKLVPLLIECDLSKCMKYKYDSYISEGFYRQKFGTKPIVISISKFKPKSNIPIKYMPLDEFKNHGIKIF